MGKSVPVQPAQDVQPQGRYVVDELKAAITTLEGRIEELERQEKELNAQGSANEKEEMKKLVERINQLEQNYAQLNDSFKKAQETAVPADPEDLFKKGKTQFSEDNFEAAAETFAQYLKNSKVKSPQDASFLRGESLFKLKLYKKAILEYSKFPEKYSHSSHMPEALYKIGLCFDALGMKDEAKGFYQELKEKYPKSAQAKKIKKKVK